MTVPHTATAGYRAQWGGHRPQPVEQDRDPPAGDPLVAELGAGRVPRWSRWSAVGAVQEVPVQDRRRPQPPDLRKPRGHDQKADRPDPRAAHQSADHGFSPGTDDHRCEDHERHHQRQAEPRTPDDPAEWRVPDRRPDLVRHEERGHAEWHQGSPTSGPGMPRRSHEPDQHDADGRRPEPQQAEIPVDGQRPQVADGPAERDLRGKARVGVVGERSVSEDVEGGVERGSDGEPDGHGYGHLSQRPCAPRLLVISWSGQRQRGKHGQPEHERRVGLLRETCGRHGCDEGPSRPLGQHRVHGQEKQRAGEDLAVRDGRVPQEWADHEREDQHRCPHLESESSGDAPGEQEAQQQRCEVDEDQRVQGRVDAEPDGAIGTAIRYCIRGNGPMLPSR